MRTAFILGAAIICATATSAMADDWRLASYTDEYPAVIVLVDAESISRSGGKVIFRAQSFFEEPLEGGATRTVEMMETDCSGTSYRTLSGVYYSGSSVLDRLNDATEIYSASSGSMNEGMILSACGKKAYQSATIANPEQYAEDRFLDLAAQDAGY